MEQYWPQGPMSTTPSTEGNGNHSEVNEQVEAALARERASVYQLTSYVGVAGTQVVAG